MTILNKLLHINLIVTPAILIILMLEPVLHKRYIPKWRYFLWILVMIILSIPLLPFSIRAALEITAPVQLVYQLPIAAHREILEETGETSEVSLTSKTPLTSEANEILETSEDLKKPKDLETPDLTALTPNTSLASNIDIILSIWLIGIIISLAYQIALYLKFSAFIKRWAVPETNAAILDSLKGEMAQMGIKANIRLMRLRGTKSPMLVGLFTPTIFYGEQKYSDKDLIFIFRHELIHYKYYDLWYKLALMLVKSVYWFNPALYFMATQANKDLEAVCDARVVKNMGFQHRKYYSEIILRLGAEPEFGRTAFTSYFGGGKIMLKKRIENILANEKPGGNLPLIILASTIVASLMLVSCSLSTNNGDSGGEIPATEKQETMLIEENVQISPNDTDNPQQINYDKQIPPGIILYEEPKLYHHEFTDVAALEIKTITDNVKITQGGDKLVLRYYEWMDNAYILTVSGGVLSLISNIPESWGITFASNLTSNIPELWEISPSDSNVTDTHWFFRDLKKQNNVKDIEIIIPESMVLDSVDITTIASSDISGLQVDKQVNVKVAKGDINISNCKFAGETQLGTSSGNLNVRDNIFHKAIAIGASSGNLNVRDNIFHKAIAIGASSGDMNIKDNMFYKAISIGTSSGNINISDNEFDGELSIGTSSGDIYLNDNILESPIDISTSSGDANIKLIGSIDDYHIEFATASGKLYYNDSLIDSKLLGNNAASKSIKFSSASGNVNIETQRP